LASNSLASLRNCDIFFFHFGFTKVEGRML